MIYRLKFKRNSADGTEDFDTIEDAIARASVGLDTDQFYPVAVTNDQGVALLSEKALLLAISEFEMPNER